MQNGERRLASRGATLGASSIFVLLLLSPVFVPGVNAQPSSGNWVVTGTEVVQNKSITLSGDLTIESGGSLTLNGVTLTMNGQSPGEYAINVVSGGSLYVENSEVTAANPQDGYSFVVMGMHFVMEKSALHGVGWCPNGLNACYGGNGGPGQNGLSVTMDNAVIRGSLISNNSQGISLVGNNESVIDNRIISDPLGSIQLSDSAHSKVAGNYINESAPFGVGAISIRSSYDNLVSNNTVSIPLHLVSGNEISGSGITLVNSWNNTITTNNMSMSLPIWLQPGSSDNVIVDNKLTTNQEGVYIQAGLSNRILNNSIDVVPQQSGGEGLYLTSAHNSTIAGNTIFGGQASGILMYGTTGSRILNNNLTTSTYESISLFGSQNNTLSGNRITNTETGLSLDYLSNGNTISDNVIVANSTLFNDCCGHGIYVQDSSENSIYHNNFIGGNLGPYDNGTNAWYSAGKGNYWSLDTQTANSGNGVLSQPYEIYPSGVDPYPLANPVVITHIHVVNTTFAPPPQNVPVPNLTDMTIENRALAIGAGYADITKSMTIENSIVTLGANASFSVNLEPGATLLIDNSTVYWEQGYVRTPTGSSVVIRDSKIIAGQKQQFAVGWNGFFQGSLLINDSTIESTPNGFGYVIENRQPAPNSSVVIDNSRLLSYGTASLDTDGPVLLFDITHIDVGNSYFAGCQDGPSGGDYDGAKGATASFVNNTFFDVLSPLSYTDTDLYQPNFHYNSTVFISGNNFNAGVTVSGGNVTFSDNNMTSGGLSLDGNRIVVTHNNLLIGSITIQGGSTVISGNYWRNYAGKDDNLDGVGDTPYAQGSIVDNQPYMQPSGWLTGFYLALDTNLPSSTHFTINGSAFSIGSGGMAAQRLGYVASYVISLPGFVGLSNGSSLAFARWSDGLTTPTRTVSLSSNSTLSATYALRAAVETTTSISSSTLSSTTSASSSSTSLTSTTSTSGGGGGIPEFPVEVFAAAASVSVIIISYLLLRRKQDLEVLK